MTDGPTDGPTDTVRCRVACPRLKKQDIFFSLFIFLLTRLSNVIYTCTPNANYVAEYEPVLGSVIDVLSVCIVIVN